ncbi:hypothetical protein Tco_0116768 [Tanacetum coccineum]
MSDMIALLNDLSYIPLNNEQNEPTQGDISETSNELTQAKRNEFEELYASDNEELYPGVDYQGGRYSVQSELIYPPAFFDIMIYFVIHLPLEAPKGGLFAPWRCFHLKESGSEAKSKFPNKYMKEEFPNWFGSQIRQRHVDNDPGVSATSELFALACGPTPTPISVNSCVVNGVRVNVPWSASRNPRVFVFVVQSCVVPTDVTRGHNGDSGGDDHPPRHHIPTGCEGCFVDRGKGTRKPNLGGRKAGRLHTSQETRNLGLKKITDDKGPVPIRFEWDDKKTMMPLGEHASHWSNYLGELIREMPLYYPSWQKVLAERKAAILTKIETQFDLTTHMQSQRWTDINAGIQQHLQKLYNTNKASLKAVHWVINPETETYDMESSATREYPSLINTFFVTHTVNGVFTRDEDRPIYEEMLRLQALGSKTPSGVPYTDEEINALDRKGKQRGHLPGVGRVLPGRATDVLIPPPPQCTHNSGDVEKLKKKNKYLTKQFGSGSGGCGDDEMADDEDGGEDEEDEEDGDIVMYLDRVNIEFIQLSTVAHISLTENLWAPPSRSGKSLEKESLASFPLQLIPGDMSLGMSIPATCRPGRHGNVAGDSGDVEKLKKKNKYLTKLVNLMMKLFRSDDKFSQMFNQYESTPEFGNGNGGCGDDEMADDEDGVEDEEDDEDVDS